MERFQLTKTIEEYRNKSKNVSTAKEKTQWMRLFCQ